MADASPYPAEGRRDLDDAFAAMEAAIRDRLIAHVRSHVPNGGGGRSQNLSVATGIEIRRVRRLLNGTQGWTLNDLVRVASAIGLDLFQEFPESKSELLPGHLKSLLGRWRPGTLSPPLPSEDWWVEAVIDAVRAVVTRYSVLDAQGLIRAQSVVDALILARLENGAHPSDFERAGDAVMERVKDDARRGSLFVCSPPPVLGRDELRDVVARNVIQLGRSRARYKLFAFILGDNHLRALRDLDPALEVVREGDPLRFSSAWLHEFGGYVPPAGELPLDVFAQVVDVATGLAGQARSVIVSVK